MRSRGRREPSPGISRHSSPRACAQPPASSPSCTTGEQSALDLKPNRFPKSGRCRSIFYRARINVFLETVFFFFFVFFLTVHPATGPLLPDSASPHQALGRTWGTSQLCDSSLTAAGAASVSIASQLGQARGAADAAVPALPPRGSLHTPRAPSESRGRGQAVGTAELFTR